MRRFAPLLIAAVCATLAGAPASADASSKLPAQGMYDTCYPEKSSDGCSSRLGRLAAAGFTVVQPMGMASRVENLSNMLTYANNADAHGLKVIWNLTPGLSDAELHELVTALQGYPSTWGYYVWDEPTAGQADEVAAFAAKVKALDPTHPRLVMGCGNCYGGENSVDFLSGADVTLGTDIYPVAEQAPDQPVVARRVKAAAAGLRRVADRSGAKTVMALQSWRWGDSYYDSKATGIGQASRFPTRREIQDQRDAAIEGGHPDLILWFTLNQTIGWEPGQRPSWWAEPTDPGNRWANLVGGAFAPLPRGVNQRPVARFTLRSRSRPGSSTVRVVANADTSHDPDGRIVRYRWYDAGKRRAICNRPRCSLSLSNRRRGTIKLVVTDDRGARTSRRHAVPNAARQVSAARGL